jgi:hypothetical protein
MHECNTSDVVLIERQIEQDGLKRDWYKSERDVEEQSTQDDGKGRAIIARKLRDSCMIC